MCKVGDECIWVAGYNDAGFSRVKIVKIENDEVWYSGYMPGEDVFGKTSKARWREWMSRDKYDYRGAP